MFGSEVLDVAIGLMFVYLVLSLICSAGCELIESLLKRRAAYLERGLQEMLDDTSGDKIVKEIYNHPLVSSLFRGKYEPGNKSNLPSYIPPANFSLALMDIIGLNGPRPDSSTSLPVTPAPLTASPEWIRSIIQANSNFSPHVTQALLVLAHSAGYDPAKIQRKIEDWYNSSMDRVSGWFKRHSQFVVLGLGFLLSLAINADTISITNTIATDKSVRESLISAAKEDSKQPPPTAQKATPENPNAPPLGPSNFQADLQQIRGAGLPLGWSTTSTDLGRVPVSPREWLLKMLGIVLTTLAISLGGPFWFDTLNQFMVVRSTVKPSEKSPEEATKS